MSHSTLMKAYNMGMPGKTVMEEQTQMLMVVNFLELHVIKNQRKMFTTITRYS